MDKQEELKNLEAEMLADTALPLREANLVFGEGDIDCGVMFVGDSFSTACAFVMLANTAFFLTAVSVHS